jgi:hypothetical protein
MDLLQVVLNTAMKFMLHKRREISSLPVAERLLGISSRTLPRELVPVRWAVIIRVWITELRQNPLQSGAELLSTLSRICAGVGRQFFAVLMCCWPYIVVMISFGSNSCTTILLYWLSPSTCFEHLCAHLQEDRLYIHHDWFNVISYDDCTVGSFVKDSRGT